MTDINDRIDELSPEKRELLKFFLKEEGLDDTQEQAYIAPRNSLEEKLAAIWAGVLGLERVGIQDNFMEIGGDSIQSIQVIAKANQAGIRMTTNQLFELQTIEKLSEVVVEASAIEISQDAVEGPVPLTPIQRWFFDLALPENHYWNQVVLLRTQSGMNAGYVEAAFQAILEHHDVLRMGYRQENGQWNQENRALGEKVAFEVVELSTAEAQWHEDLEAACIKAQSGLDLSEGPMMKIIWFDLGEGEAGRLFLVTHHLIVDGLSFRIMLEDLETAYAQLSRGEDISLPLKTTSFQQWAQRIQDLANSPEMGEEIAYWRQLPDQVTTPPMDFQDGDNHEDRSETVLVKLSAEDTHQLLHQVLHDTHAQINGVLISALVAPIADWTGQDLLVMDMEGHGREELFDDLDISRTVGWFTSVFPIALNRVAGHAKDQLGHVQEVLKAVPQRGVGYGILRECRTQEDAHCLRAMPSPKVCFNYLGQFDQTFSADSPFGHAAEGHGPMVSGRGERPHLLNIIGMVEGGCLQFSWVFSRDVFKSSTIARVAQSFMDGVRSFLKTEDASDDFADGSEEGLEDLLMGDF